MINRLKTLHIFNAAKLSVATAVGQIISYVAAPILSRIYSPQDFALFAKFYAWIVPLAVLSTWRFEFSIPGTSNIQVAWLHARWSMRSSLYMALAIGIIFYFSSFFGMQSWYWSYLITLGILSISLAQVYNFLTTKLNAYRLNAYSRIINNLVLNGMSILLGWWGMIQWGLIAGFIIGQTATIVFFFLALRLSGRQHPWSESDGNVDWSMVRPYVLYNTPQGVLDTLQLSGIIATLECWYSSTITGAYYLCWRFLQAPVTLISNTIFLSQYPKASAMRQSGTGYRPMILRTGILLFLMSAPIGVVLFLWGPELFAFFFGEGWYTAGQFAAWLAPWFVLNFSVSPFSYASLIEGGQRVSFIIAIIDLCSKVICLYWGQLNKDAVTAIAIFSVSSSVILLITYAWYLRLSR